MTEPVLAVNCFTTTDLYEAALYITLGCSLGSIDRETDRLHRITVLGDAPLLKMARRLWQRPDSVSIPLRAYVMTVRTLYDQIRSRKAHS